MTKDDDYAGPSSRRKRQGSKVNEDHDRSVAARLQEDRYASQEHGRGIGQLKISKDSVSNFRNNYGKEEFKGKTKESAREDMYPKPIAKALEDLQKWTRMILETKCRKCKKEVMQSFEVNTYFKQWEAMHSAKKEFSICSVRCPDEDCGADTCVGCEDKPRTGKYTAIAKIKHGMKLDWCCSGGQVFALWVVLCRYDEEELRMRSESAKVLASRKPTKSTSQGTGYGGNGSYPLFGSFFSPSPRNSIGQRQRREATDDSTRDIFSLVVELLPREPKTCIDALCAMLELNLLQDKAGSLLRNDSLRNITPRGDVYFAVLAYVERLGKHSDTSYLVCEPRYPKERSAGLLSVSLGEVWKENHRDINTRPLLVLRSTKEGMDPSLIECMAKLATQSENIVSAAKSVNKEFETESGKDVLEIARRILSVYGPLAPKKHKSKAGVMSWEAYQESCRVEWVTDMFRYMCEKYKMKATALIYSKPDRYRRIVSEIGEMTTSLPQNIFVRVDEVRPDCIKALIIGPRGTPYEGGLFEFDIFCTGEYPNLPPKVMFRTTGGGVAHFNPNLYPNGKVCLSLLNTWHGGDASERWMPKESTILSVLISIQAMILCDHPIGNEPGMEMHVGTATSARFNKQLQAYTVRYAILDWVREPHMRDGVWREVVKRYFAMNRDHVLNTVRHWARENTEIQNFGGPTSNLFNFMLGIELGRHCNSSSWGRGSNLLSGIEQALGVGDAKGKGRA